MLSGREVAACGFVCSLQKGVDLSSAKYSVLLGLKNEWEEGVPGKNVSFVSSFSDIKKPMERRHQVLTTSYKLSLASHTNPFTSTLKI